MGYEKESGPPGKDVDGGSTEAPDVEIGETAPQLHRKLQGRHMQMIAIGGSIGAGLFVGSGSALASGGPASLVIDFIIIGIMMLLTVNALGELACMYPVEGAFYDYSVRFIDPSWGFAMGWNYTMNWLVVLPFELTSAGVTIAFWTDDNGHPINVGVWITIFLILVIVINIFGVRGYGEVEFILGSIKVIAVIGFIILGIIIDCGGVSTDNRGYIGAKYWSGANVDGVSHGFRNGFKGWCSVFVTASFAFGGTELVGLAAAEATNPRKTLPKASKQVFWRISLFYVVSLFIMGLIVPSDDSNLSGASGGNTKYSPFVNAIKLAGIKGLPSVFNAVITISVISVANSCTFASTRTIQALCVKGMGPAAGAKVDKHGRPYIALIFSLAFGFLAYLNELSSGGQIFTWLLSLSGLSNFFTWGSINLAHIRFRTAWYRNGRTTDDLPFAAMFGVIGSYIGLTLNILCLIAQFYVALWPIGGKPEAKAFFESYLGFPIIMLFYIGYKVYYNDWSLCVDLNTIDIDAGRRGYDKETFDAEMAEERAERAVWPAWKKVWRFFT